MDVYNFHNIPLGLACLALLVNCKHLIAYSWAGMFVSHVSGHKPKYKLKH